MDFVLSEPMGLDMLLPWSLSMALLSVRLTVALTLSPALSAYGVSAAFRFATAIGLAMVTFFYRAPASVAATWAQDPSLWVQPLLSEVFIGAWLGLSMHVVLAAFSRAGRLLGAKIGFGVGSVFDLGHRGGVNVLACLLGLSGVMLFFVSDASLALGLLVSRSIDAFPLGELPLLGDPIRPLIASGSMLALGLSICAPVAVALLLTDILVRVASRSLRRLEGLVPTLPLRVALAWVVLVLSVVGWVPVLWRTLDRLFDVVGMHPSRSQGISSDTDALWRAAGSHARSHGQSIGSACPYTAPETAMPKYLIERTVPGVGASKASELHAISQKSCSVLRGLGPEIQWVQSYVTGDKIYCIYLADSEAPVKEHARRGGFPADSIAKVLAIIDPTTAEA